MYGNPVPTSFPAGLPAPVAAASFGLTQSMWLALLVLTLVTLAMAVSRLVPRRQR